MIRRLTRRTRPSSAPSSTPAFCGRRGPTSISRWVRSLTPGLRAFYNACKTLGYDPRLRGKVIESGSLLRFGSDSIQHRLHRASRDFRNEELTYERCMHYVLGLMSQWNSSWNTEAQVFYKSSDNMVAPGIVNHYENSGGFRSHGLELLHGVRRQAGCLVGSHTLKTTTRRDPSCRE